MNRPRHRSYPFSRTASWWASRAKFLLTQPAGTFASIKRKMGQRYTRTVHGKEYTPESISAIILRHLKEYGENALAAPIDEAVITVPAHFNSTSGRPRATPARSPA